MLWRAQQDKLAPARNDLLLFYMPTQRWPSGEEKNQNIYIYPFAWKETWTKDLIHWWQLIAWLLVSNLERVELNNWWWRCLKKTYVDGPLVMGTEWDGIVSYAISHKNMATAEETFKNKLIKFMSWLKPLSLDILSLYKMALRALYGYSNMAFPYQGCYSC